VEGQSSSTPKVIVPIPDGYWDLPEDERLAAAEAMAAQLQRGLPGSSCS
jgi:hypothetical protein